MMPTVSIAFSISLALPFARLRFNTFLPFAVLILFLKPCSTFLCLFFG